MSDLLKVLSHEWNAAAEELMQRLGTVQGTRALLRHVLHDERLGDKTALTSSFGHEAAVLLALVAEIRPTTPVILVQPGHLDYRTLEYRDQIVPWLGLTDVRTPEPTREQANSFDPLADVPTCCGAVKKEILQQAMQEFSVWISGRKRYQGGERTEIPLVEYSGGKIKVNPLALWTEEQANLFMDGNDLPRHPLKYSIGCWPCSKEGVGREGRTFGKPGQTECGIHHTFTNGDGI